MTASEHSIDLRDYADDPLTAEIRTLARLVADWSAETLEGVCQTLDDLGLLCATRADADQREAGRYLALTRRLLRAAAAHTETEK